MFHHQQTTKRSRSRPPNIDLSLTGEKPQLLANIELEAESPLDLSDDDVFEDTLQLSSPESDSPPSTSPLARKLSLSSHEGVRYADVDDLSKDLEELEQLRKSVQQNLRLRPIRSRTDLPKVNLVDGIPASPFPSSSSSSSSVAWENKEPPQSAASTNSAYYTPMADTPSSARYIGSVTSSQFPFSSPRSSWSSAESPHPALLTTPLYPRPSRPIDAATLYRRLTGPIRPLLIDTRPAAVHFSFHIRYSINIAIPSLILKRCRKPGGGFPALDSLRQFITSEQGKEAWDVLIRPAGPWDGDVVIYDDEMDPKDKGNVSSTAWALLPVIAPLLSFGSVDYLEGGLSAAGHDPDLETLVVTPGDNEIQVPAQPAPPPILLPPPTPGGRRGRGLFQLDTQSSVSRSKSLPEIEPMSAVASPRSPMPLMPTAMPPPRIVNGSGNDIRPPSIDDYTPSPPPSQIGFRRPPPPRNSVPNLRKIETTSAERLNSSLPKLSLRTLPIKSQTLSVPSSANHHYHNPHQLPPLNLQAPASPSHLTLAYSSHSPPVSARWNTTSFSAASSATPSSSSSPNAQYEFLSSYYSPPHTPATPRGNFPPSPQTARPDLDNLPSTEDAMPSFTISTILPSFLYLGPELTTPEHVQELKALGVRRILNIAIECDDDHGLGLREKFERYVKIPMRDTVEEDGIKRGVREACDNLGGYTSQTTLTCH